MNISEMKNQISEELLTIPVPERAISRERAYRNAITHFRPRLPASEWDWLSRRVSAHFRT